MSNLNVQKILTILPDLTLEQLNSVNQAIVVYYKLKQNQAAKEFAVGDKVTLKSKVGRVINAVITKVNRNTVNIFTTDSVSYKVSPSLLTKA
jgi:hypothetical protein